jgi:hypothetical protein
MKKIEVMIILVMVLGIGWILVREFVPRSPDGIHGQLKSAAVTMMYFSSTPTNAEDTRIREKTIFIREPPRLAGIERSLKSIPNGFGPNSHEGYPQYHMRVQYVDGTTQSFYFTRTEFGSSGSTPHPLLEELEKNGL